MRAFLMTVLTLSLSGCLFGASRGQTTTSYVNDDGIHPVQRTTITQTSNGTTVGASVPLVLGGGMMYAGGGAYGGATIMGGGYGGGNTACVLHPDRCAVMQTATVYQPVTITSSGGGYVGGAAVSGVGGGRTSMVGSGGAGTYVETDDSELTAMLAKHEKALSVVVGATKQNSRQICQILIANPDTIADPDERKDVVSSCQDYLSKHPYKTAQKEGK
jgi:hypothetical protein